MSNFNALDAPAQDRLLEGSYEAGVADAVAGDPLSVPYGTGPECEAAYREGYGSVRLVPDAEAAPMPAASPAEHRAEAVAEDAADLLAHMLLCGPLRFDARRKVADAARYTEARLGSSLAVPSKLAAVGPFQDRIERLAEAARADGSGFYPALLYRSAVAAAYGDTALCLLVRVGDDYEGVGFVQDKHTPWLAPLLTARPDGDLTSDGSAVRVYVTAVTGGTPEKPTRGVNVVLCGCAEAARKHADRLAAEARMEAAYASGDPAAIEAALV